MEFPASAVGNITQSFISMLGSVRGWGPSEVPQPALCQEGRRGARTNRAGGGLLPSRQPRSATLSIEFACHLSSGEDKAPTARHSWRFAKKATEGQDGSVPAQGCSRTIAGTGLEFRALSPGSGGRGKEALPTAPKVSDGLEPVTGNSPKAIQPQPSSCRCS